MSKSYFSGYKNEKIWETKNKNKNKTQLLTPRPKKNQPLALI